MLLHHRCSSVSLMMPTNRCYHQQHQDAAFEKQHERAYRVLVYLLTTMGDVCSDVGDVDVVDVVNGGRKQTSAHPVASIPQ
jgi:hypothetical protein